MTVADPAIAQFRVARPTDRLDEVLRFYRDGLGLAVIGSFEGHAGYDGVMLALDERGNHLEFTRHVDGSPCPAPTRDNLLVLYVPGRVEWETRVRRMVEHGYEPVEPENPYWERGGTTFEDPDGWRVVLMNTAGFGGGQPEPRRPHP